MTTWLVILAVALGSFAFRLVPLLVFQRVAISERGDRMIRDAGTAAIAALIVVSTKQSATGDAVLPALLAVAAAVVLAARGASMVLLLITGIAIYSGAVLAMNLVAQ